MRILSIFVFVHFFVVFCFYLLSGAFLNFCVIIALFAYLKCKCEKNYTFSNILQKVKSYFFANIYHSPCDSYWNSKKYKIEAPNVQLYMYNRKRNSKILTITYKRSQTYVDTVYKKRSTLKLDKAFIQISAYLYFVSKFKGKSSLTILSLKWLWCKLSEKSVNFHDF